MGWSGRNGPHKADMGQIFQKGLDNPISPEIPTKPLFKKKEMSSQPKETSEWEQQIHGGFHWLSTACGALQAHVGAVCREAQGQGPPGGTRKGLFGPECEGGTQSTKPRWDFRRSVEVLRTSAAHFSDGGTLYFPTMATTASPTPHALRNGTWTPKAP